MASNNGVALKWSAFLACMLSQEILGRNPTNDEGIKLLYNCACAITFRLFVFCLFVCLFFSIIALGMQNWARLTITLVTS